MDDIFKSKENMERDEKINNLFKSAANPTEGREEPKPLVIPESERIIAAEPSSKKWKFLVNILLVVIFLGLASAAGYFFWQYKKVTQNSQTVPAVDEAALIVEKIKNLADLPPENPVVAIISNQIELTDQSLFPDALAGDKVLIYIQSQKAVLYRPSTNEVLKTISLISIKSTETETTADSSEEKTEKTSEKIETKVKVDVLNGTEIKGLAKETADKLSGMENVEVAKVGNTQKSAYTKILVVDLSGKNETAAKIIAQKLGGEVSALPAGESKGTADILVISGK